MILFFEKIFDFIFYFYKKFFFFIYFFNIKNFFFGKFGYFTYFFLFKKKNRKNLKFLKFFNYYKFIFNKLIFIKYNNFTPLSIKFLNLNFIKFLFFCNFFKINLLNLFCEKLKNYIYLLGFKLIFFSNIQNNLNNFYFLNTSFNHPSQLFSDTFYIGCDYINKILLITHTTCFQSFGFINMDLPIKIFSIEKVFRPDFDSTHIPMFTQLEFLWIDKYLNLLILKTLIIKILKFIFKKKLIFRFRNTYFPFTYLSFEVDILCNYNFNKFIWLEVFGFGFVHKYILFNMNINSDLYKAIALGFGIERLLMLYYGFNDLNFLNFGFYN